LVLIPIGQELWQGATAMKRFIDALAVAVALGLCFIVAIVIRDVKHKSWMEHTPGEIKRLAIGVEEFREEKGAYPSKLSELQTVSDLYDKEYLSELLAGKSGNQYQYRTASNGFVITVTKNARWFFKGEVMEKFYKPGEILNGEVQTIIKTGSGVSGN